MPVLNEHLVRLTAQLNEGIVQPHQWEDALGTVAQLMDAEDVVVTDERPEAQPHTDLILPIELLDGHTKYLFLQRRENHAFADEDVQRAQRLVPCFRSALKLRQHVQQLQARHSQAAYMLDSFDMPALLLDQNAQVVLSNAAGQAWLHSTASIVGPRRAPDSDTARFRQCLRAACGLGMTAQSAAMQLRATADHPAQYLVLSPAANTMPDAPTSVEPLAMLVVRSGASHRDRTGRLFAELFDLTPAEIRLLHRLIGGDSLADAARYLKVQMPTVRTHLQSIFRKTETSRQSELLALAATLVDTPYTE